MEPNQPSLRSGDYNDNAIQCNYNNAIIMQCRLLMSLLQESLYAMQLTMWSPQVTIFMQLDKTVTIRKRETFTSFDSAKVKHFSENI